MHACPGVIPEQVFAAAAAELRPRLRRALAAVAEALADELAASSSSRSCRARAGCASTTRATCRAAPARRPARRPARVRRDRDRFRPDRQAVRRRPGGRAPDVMCVGKALTGGYLTLAAALCTPAVAAVISDGGRRRADARPDVHGQPAGLRSPSRRRSSCCAALARGGRRDLRRPDRGARPGREVPGVLDVRVLGAIGVVQLDRPVDVPAAGAAERAGCGCARSATSSTPCRRTSPRRTTWPASPGASSRRRQRADDRDDPGRFVRIHPIKPGRGPEDGDRRSPRGPA